MSDGERYEVRHVIVVAAPRPNEWNGVQLRQVTGGGEPQNWRRRRRGPMDAPRWLINVLVCGRSVGAVEVREWECPAGVIQEAMGCETAIEVVKGRVVKSYRYSPVKERGFVDIIVGGRPFSLQSVREETP